MRLSVITIALNPGPMLARTIRSIVDQTHADLQWVVVDGGSQDGSVEALRDLPRPPDVLVSEPDRGIADAMNKGLRLADGEAVLFMNAGDEFAAPDSLAQLVAAWDRTRFRWIMGAADIVDGAGRLLFRRGFAQQPRDPWSLVRCNCQVTHQAVLAERSLFDAFGGYDERWRVAMDYDLWVRWIARGCAPQCCLVPVCRFHRGGASSDPMRNHREWQAVRRAHGVLGHPLLESALTGLAWTKGRIRGRYGRWLYRLKEALGMRW